MEQSWRRSGKIHRLWRGLPLICGIAWQSGYAASPSIFNPQSGPAESEYHIAMFTLAITGAIFVVVGGLLFYAVTRYRQRNAKDDTEPPQIFGSTQIEVAWTIIPLLIVATLFLTTARMIFAIQDAPKPKSAVDVTVVGHQYWWEFRYPKLGIDTVNELHVPLSSPKNERPTYLKLLSADVFHSFWVPELAGKLGVIPNRENETWIDPYKPGIYLGQCAQFCGTSHAKMLLRVYVQPQKEFDAWVAEQAKPAVEDPGVAQGRQIFESTACVSCHTVRGTAAHGKFGPDLTHLMSRDTLASGAVPNTPENLRQWIKDPASIKPGSLMPAMQLTDDQLNQVVAYLLTLH